MNVIKQCLTLYGCMKSISFSAKSLAKTSHTLKYLLVFNFKNKGSDIFFKAEFLPKLYNEESPETRKWLHVTYSL